MTRPSTNIDKKLIKAAKELLPKTGFTNLSVRMVAKKAGVNLGMFNYYFKTKDRFVETLLLDAYEEFFEKFELESQTGANSLEQLKNAVFSIAVFARENRTLLAMLIEDVVQGNHKIIEFVRKNMTRHITVLIKLIRKCQKDGYVVNESLFTVLPTLIIPVIGPNVIIRLLEKHLADDMKLSLLVKLAGTQILTDKAIKKRMDIVLNGLALEKKNEKQKK